MPFVRVTDYRITPFSKETARGGYKFANVSEIKSLCSPYEEDIIKVHCIGVFYSEDGTFYLKDLPQCSSTQHEDVQVSVVYMPSPPLSTVHPYIVHAFGELIWRKRPVMIAHIIKHMHTPIATKLHESMNRVKRLHVPIIECNTDEY